VSDQKSTPEGQSELRSAVEANSKKKRSILITAIAVVVAALLAVGGIVFANSLGGQKAEADSNGASTEPIRVKIAVSEDNDFQAAIKQVAAEKGLEIEWVNTQDWVLPNTELVAGNVDANAFQHILYLSAFNAKSEATLTPVFSTVITQWGIFSKTLAAIDELPEAGRVAIPEDPSNGGRALNILASAGLIELSDDAGDFPTTDDVAANPKNLEFVPIAATSIPTQFDDPSLSAVVVGTSYFDPSQGVGADDALYLDDSLNEKNLPYINVIATRAADVDNPAWAILKQVYADARVAAALEKETFGSSVLVDIPIDTLRDKLADLQKSAEQSK
jgi:D-methionine transport system substrate-binding protein